MTEKRFGQVLLVGCRRARFPLLHEYLETFLR